MIYISYWEHSFAHLYLQLKTYSAILANGEH